MMKTAPENTQKTNPFAMSPAHSETIPLRCYVCGKTIACYYPETVPGIIFATCRNGHKIKIRKDDCLRKAV